LRSVVILKRQVRERFSDMLKGGHPNSLGRASEVVDIVMSDRGRLDELFVSCTDPDAVVRMRAGDALEKVCRTHPGWFAPYVEQLLGELAASSQQSVRWHVAQMLQHLRGLLSDEQVKRATEVLERYLTSSTDWIVLNVTMDVLTEWSASDPELARWLTQELSGCAGTRANRLPSERQSAYSI
jgi:hypothetical protein